MSETPPRILATAKLYQQRGYFIMQNTRREFLKVVPAALFAANGSASDAAEPGRNFNVVDDLTPTVAAALSVFPSGRLMSCYANTMPPILNIPTSRVKMSFAFTARRKSACATPSTVRAYRTLTIGVRGSFEKPRVPTNWGISQLYSVKLRRSQMHN